MRDLLGLFRQANQEFEEKAGHLEQIGAPSPKPDPASEIAPADVGTGKRQISVEDAIGIIERTSSIVTNIRSIQAISTVFMRALSPPLVEVLGELWNTLANSEIQYEALLHLVRGIDISPGTRANATFAAINPSELLNRYARSVGTVTSRLTCQAATLWFHSRLNTTESFWTASSRRSKHKVMPSDLFLARSTPMRISPRTITRAVVTG